MEPTLLREMASADVFSVLGSPVYRTGYYQLFINGIAFGARVALELYDENFLNSRFGQKGLSFLFSSLIFPFIS